MILNMMKPTQATAAASLVLIAVLISLVYFMLNLLLVCRKSDSGAVASGDEAWG